MSDGLSTERLTEIIKTGSPDECIAYLARQPQKIRRRMADTAVALFMEWNKQYFDFTTDKKRPTDLQFDAARVAVLATASLSEVKSCGWNICPPENLMIETFMQFRPEWLGAWIGFMLNDRPFSFRRLHTLWEKGLCEKPHSEAYFLAMIVAPRHSHWPDSAESAHPPARERGKTLANRLRGRSDLYPDLWRFFEIEGHGEFSLAAYDKYNHPDGKWASALCELSRAGLMDRGRLLDASLEALSRDFAQFRAGWYSRFFETMAPSTEERIERKDRFLQLLGSAIPPTVSFALKSLKKIDKSCPIDSAQLLDTIPPVLQARQKGTVVAGLRLVEAAVKREPDTRAQAVPVILEALIHEAADTQTKVLDLLEKLGIADHAEMLDALKVYIDDIAPSLRSRVTALCGVQATQAPARPLAASRLPSILHPIDSFDEFIAEFLRILEDTSDPLRVERLIDGLACHGADMPSDFDKAVGPLARRATQILKSASDTTLRYALAHLARSYADRTPPQLPDRMLFGSMVSLGWAHLGADLGDQNFVTIFIKRSIDILRQSQKGLRLPLICSPTNDGGFVAPQAVVERVSAYIEAKASPSPYDLGIALMRLAPDGREAAVNSLTPDCEFTRALHFALGGPLTLGRLSIGKTKWLWVAAATARLPRTDEPRISSIAGLKAPDVGLNAHYEISIGKRVYDAYAFSEINVGTSPPITKPLPDTYLSGLFHLTTAGKFSGSICGHNADDIRWASFVWPLNLEPFFSQGVDVFDSEQKLSNSPYAAFIEPMLLPHVTLGPVGTLLLSRVIAGVDPAVRSLAEEALIAGIAENRIDNDLFAKMTLDLITKAELPAARWTRAFGAVAKISSRHATYVCDLITKMMRFDPTKPPRDIGGLVELLFELHVETGKQLTDADARACLRSAPSGGKFGKFSKRLLSD